jgi:Spy/CpxP family protein refolding chaperone
MKYLIGVLAVIIAIVCFNQQTFSQKRNFKEGKYFRNELKENLNLTTEQEKKIANLRYTQQTAMIKFKADIDLKELEMKKLRESENISRADMVKLINEISAIKNQIALLRVNHQMDVYDLLDANQKKAWLEMQDKIGMNKERMRENIGERMKDDMKKQMEDRED